MSNARGAAGAQRPLFAAVGGGAPGPACSFQLGRLAGSGGLVVVGSYFCRASGLIDNYYRDMDGF